MFGLLDITTLQAFSLGACFETYEPFTFLIFKLFPGNGKEQITETWILNQWIRGHTCSMKTTNSQKNIHAS
jgi:hypothetical protein